MRGRRVAVWGAGRSGVAAANLLADLGARPILSDSRPADSLAADALDERVDVRGGGNVLDGADLLVPSPGLPPHNPALRAALAEGVTLVSEIELAASVAVAPVVAIGGTDGKSTTTEMIAALLRAAGRAVAVGGNIGIPLSEVARSVDADGVVVAEVSAFQLWSCGHFRPRVSVITNVASDHAEYFEGDVSAYQAAKARQLADMGPGDTAILRADDPVVWGFALPDGVARVAFGPAPRELGWGFDGDALTRDGRAVASRADVPLPGPHNIANALAALAAGDALGAPIPAMVEGLRSFEGLPHRLQRVRVRDGVTFYDDSKATNPHAAVTGLRALDGRLVVIAGGYEKGLDHTDFAATLADRADHVVLLGQTSGRLEGELAGRVTSERALDMSDAVRRAADAARDGQAVVLSPGASSFDLFQSYGARGRAFQEAVRALPEGG